MNNQQAFDKMVTHAFTQKVRAVNSGETKCKYRADKGLKCFVGALISDADYLPTYEGQLAYEILNKVKSLEGLSHVMLGDMQHIHDRTEPSMWFDNFVNVALAHKFDDTVLKTFEEVEL